MALGGLNVLVLAGIGVLGLGALLHIIGTATPAWSVLGPQEWGPYKICGRLGCGSRNAGGPSDVEAVRALAVIGCLLSMFAGLAALGMLILAIMGKGVNRLFPIIILGASLGAFAFIILGDIVWAASVHADPFDLGYSFILSIVGGVLVAIGGVLIFLSARGASRSTTVA